MNRFLLLAMGLLALLCSSALLRAEGPEDEYVHIYNLIQQADALAERGREELARQKYLEAQTQLDQVQKAYPGWNEQVVQFRLNYVMEKLGLVKTAEKAIRREPAEKSEPASAEPADRIKLLLDQIRQLTADKELLQARLKEALSAQPAAVDARELARSEEIIKSLRKEVEVLSVNLRKAETKPDKTINLAALDQTKRPIPEARLNELATRRDIELVTKTRTLEKQLADARRKAQTNADLVSVLQNALRRAQEEKDALAGEKRQPKTSTDSAPTAPPTAQRGQVEALTTQSANLEAAQISQNRLAEGEANLKRALAADPKSAVSLSLLGVIKVRQHKYDEALDLLSQSAQLDPQNADTFQYLGVTLAEKGLRKPAESAFRRAIQLAPENGEAHHNLAIVYATQQPPALELARLHYQKGLASGHPKDSKLEQLLSANKPAVVGGVNASNR